MSESADEIRSEPSPADLNSGLSEEDVPKLAEERSDSKSDGPAAGVFVWSITFAPVVILIGAWAYSSLGPQVSAATLEVLASASPESDSQQVVRVAVIDKGERITNADVWAIAIDSRGHEFLATRQNSDTKAASYELRFGESTKSELKEIRVFARRSDSKSSQITEKRLYLDGRPLRTLKSAFPFSGLVAVVALFVCSLALGFFRPLDEKLIRLKWMLSVIQAFLLWSIMLLIVCLSLATVASESRDSTFRTSFGNVFFGSYVEQGDPDWIVSLTTPQCSVSGQNAYERGFGAPIWVIFVAVFGSGLFTLSIVLKALRIDFSDLQQARAANLEIVQHQFYTFFSPFTAIFIYQLQVLAGAAREPVTVAITALAAGLCLGAILARAVRSAEHLLEVKAQK